MKDGLGCKELQVGDIDDMPPDVLLRDSPKFGVLFVPVLSSGRELQIDT